MQRKVTPLPNIPIFCLNLDRRPDRKLQAWRQFRREGLAVKRIAALDAVGIEDARGWRNVGARACALSHRLAWRWAQRAGAEAVVVFEDDVQLREGFVSAVERLAVPEDWQLFYFGCTLRHLPEVVTDGVVRVTGPTWETHAMAVRAALFPRLHRLLASISHRRPDAGSTGVSEHAIDNLLVEIHREVPVYAAYPALAWQGHGLSNIDNSVRNFWTADGRQSTHLEVTAELDRRTARWREERLNQP